MKMLFFTQLIAKKEIKKNIFNEIVAESPTRISSDEINDENIQDYRNYYQQVTRW